MATVIWQDSYNTGIEEVDNQHKQLVAYLNQLDDAIKFRDKSRAMSVIGGLHDYTMSHFAFEESLMEEAKYPYVGPHKHVHQALIKRVVDFDTQLKAGEEIMDDLYAFLRRWLINHIQRDDAAYVTVVTGHFNSLKKEENTDKKEPVRSGWISRMSKKIFG